jgi:hypothetical protein
LVDHPTTKTPKRSRADEILEEAELKAARRMKGSGAQEAPVLITPRELVEDEAVGKWCENISVKCTEEAPTSKTKGQQAEDILGESSTPYVPSTPSSPPSEENQLPPPSGVATEVDGCCVSVGSLCYITQGMSLLAAPAA